MDFDLHPKDGASEVAESDVPPRARPPIGPILVIGVLAVAAGLAIYIVFGRKASGPVETPAAAPPPQVTEESIKPLGGDGDRITLPPLDESDPVVRDLVVKLSKHPRVAAWLTTKGLIRNFTAVVANIAEGNTPSGQLQVLRPTGAFQVIERDDDVFIDPRSYERYDALADAVASIDAAGSARLYATVKPRVEEAYRDLGFPNARFDSTLEAAIIALLATPVPSGATDVGPRGGVGYAYTDPRLEQLTAAQKQLLRMGPRNARIVQRKLREIALELGIPASRLPTPR